LKKSLWAFAFLLISISLLFFLPEISEAEKQTSAIIWTNKKEYYPDETALVFGYGFNPLSQINITVIRPNLIQDFISTSTDEFGYFSCQYTLDGVHGTYNATATDGVHEASTTFDNCFHLKVKWSSHCCWYINARAIALKIWKSYYIKYFDPLGEERRTSPTYTGRIWFKDSFTISPSLPNILGTWTVVLYEGSQPKRTKEVYIDKMVWTTDSTYSTLVTSFGQGETLYYKVIGLKTDKYYKIMLETPSKTKFYITNWTTGVTSIEGQYSIPSDAEVGSWKLHVKEAFDASGTCEHHYVDTCYFEITSPPPPLQYYLTVRTNPLGITSIPGEGWYTVNTYVNLTAPDLVNGSDGVRYVFDYWDIDGTSQGAGVNPISVYMDTNHTATAHYTTQYYLNVTANPSGVTTPAGTGWYDSGTYASIFAPEFVSITPETSRYKFDSWTTGDISEIVNPYSPFTTVLVDKAKTVTANYKVQYSLTVHTNGLDAYSTNIYNDTEVLGIATDATPYKEWFDEGTVILLDIDSLITSGSERRQFIEWSGDASGLTRPITITMDSAKDITANYKTQFLIMFDCSGISNDFLEVVITIDENNYGVLDLPVSFWWDKNSVHNFAFASPLNVDGKRYIWISTSGLSSRQGENITITGSGNVVGNYKTQYLITFNQTGLSNSALGTVVTVNGTAKTFSDLPFSMWVNEGTQITYDYENIVSSSIAGEQFKLANVDGPASPFTVNETKTITGNYKTQFEIIFNQTGVSFDFMNTILVIDGSNYNISDLPLHFWWDKGSVHDFSFVSPLVVALNEKRYIWTATSGLSTTQSETLTVTESGEITATYKTQYYLTVRVDPPGITMISGEGWYNKSVKVSLIAPTVANYNFEYWDIDGASQSSGVNPITVQMDSPHTATAHYSLIRYTLVISSTTGGTTTPAPGTYTYDPGTLVSVTAVPETNYIFDHWELDSIDVSAANPITVTMNSDHTLYAIFTYSPTLSISVSPTSTTIEIGKNVTFTSAVSGGTSPYSYQWYLNGTPVSGATTSTWTFTPTSPGTYHIYVNVTDKYGFSASSQTAIVNVVSPKAPMIVGGESTLITVQPWNAHLAVYMIILTILYTVLAIIGILKKKKRK